MTYIRTLTILVRVNTGPPTWWRPDVGASVSDGKILHLRLGWLRACAQIAVGSKRARGEEAA